jgi:hypothetical protein
MKFKRNLKIKLSFLLIILGWFIIGLSWSVSFIHSINTILLLLGLVLAFIGFILFILTVNRK